MNVTAEIHQRLDPENLRFSLPSNPGVYLFKDSTGGVIYVGKAKNLKKRVMSYFRPPADLPDKTSHMMSRAASLDTIITSTEQEAFILEGTLIKKYMPRYNVILRDDKRYPVLRLDVQEPFPRLTVVRKIRKDGALYFGPFSSAGSMRSTLKVVERLFPLRKCKGRGLPKRSRPCLNYQMGRCLGVCVHPVDPAEYCKIVQQVRLFLESRNRELTAQLQGEMLEASARLDFEKAAALRDQIAGVERVVERQHVVLPRIRDLDAVGFSTDGDNVRAAVLYIRNGAVVGSRKFVLDAAGSETGEVIEAFLTQHYALQPVIPGEILISDPLEDQSSIEEWFTGLTGRKIRVHQPLRGEKRRIVQMAVENAGRGPAGSSGPDRRKLMEMVMRVFGLQSPPRRIEGLDISNIQGQKAVGSVVSFIDGLPHRAGYRNFQIETVDDIDDYRMMQELISRRLVHDPLPDLFLVDGGKGHLSAVIPVLDSLQHGAAPAVAAIAKAERAQGETADKLYIRGRKNPIRLGRNDPVLMLMMRIRDEAHRRAVGYHRSLRAKSIKGSVLDGIEGVGSVRRKALLEHFKSIEEMAGADVEEISRVPGVPPAVARRVVDFFRG
ncbi:MAG TPA: excinuclease ABC subunit UvrC [Desulfobacteraceae bacterium]|nr:excinuclease ABC subunit UvrC [Desulfobacteraceae bacterium]